MPVCAALAYIVCVDGGGGLQCVHMCTSIQLTLVRTMCVDNAQYNTLHLVTDQTVCAVFGVD